MMVRENYLKKEGKNKRVLFLVISLVFLILLLFILNYNQKIIGFLLSENTENQAQNQSLAFIRFAIPITKAEHLDSGRNFISDIYDKVKALDDTWSEAIPDNHYIRVTFEQNLTRENDITLYPRISSGSPRVEVYEKDKTEKIADFMNLISNKYNKVYLTNLKGAQNSFDLRILNGSIEIEHVVDPVNDYYVDSYDGTSAAWTNVGSSPYLSVQDTPANEITVASSNKNHGDFGFSDLLATATSINSATFYIYANCGSEAITVYLWDNSASAYVAHALGACGAYGWESFSATELTTVAEVNAAKFYVRSVSVGGWAGTVKVDSAYLRVDYNVADTEYPQFSDYWDNNATQVGTGTGYFNVTLASTNGTVILQLGGTNYTASNSSGDPKRFNVTIESLSEGTYPYNWTSYGNGTAKNFNISNHKYYTVNATPDTIPPSIQIQYPANNTNTSNAGIDVNYTVYNGADTCWYSNMSGLVNYTWGCNNITNVTWSEGINNVTIWANDTIGNVNVSHITFYVDTIFPSIQIVYPANNTNTTNTGIDVNYTVYNGHKGCWYTNNSGVNNYTLVDCANLSDVTWGEGISNVTVWTNDSARNENVSYVTFYVDTQIPYFTNLETQLITEIQSLNYDINAQDDGIGLESFAINWTGTFSIVAATGVLTNISGLSIGNYYINVSINDTLGNLNSSVLLIQVISADSVPPNVTSSTETPADGATYSFDAAYEFNTTLEDISSISKVLLEFNGTNHTASTIGGNVYNVTVRGLTTGTFNYRWFANDSLGNTNNTETGTYTINKAAPTGAISGTASITYGTMSDVQGTESNGGDADLTYKLFRDNIEVAGQDTALLGVGTYNYVYNTTEGRNYSSSASLDVFSLTVNKANPSGSLTSTNGWTINYAQGTTIGASESNGGDADLTYSVFRDNINVGGGAINFSAGTYSYKLNTTGGVNWSSSSSIDAQTLTINQITSDVNLTLGNMQKNASINEDTSIDLNCSILSGDSKATLRLYNHGVLINEKNSPVGNTTPFNIAGRYNITCIYFETTNFTQGSETWWIEVNDTTRPQVSIVFPQNNTNNTNTQLNVNFTVSDEIGLSRCWYTNNSGKTNNTLTCGENITEVTWIEGINNVSVYANDTSGNINASHVTFIIDTTKPSISSLTETPSEPAGYTENGRYEFNATISDSTLESVLFEFNEVNYTASTIGDNIYNFSVSNLAVGNYTYRWYANDSFGNVNNTETGNYNISKASPSLSLSLTPSDTEIYGTETTATGSGCPSQLTCSLFREDIQVTSPETAVLEAGTHNYIYNTTGNINYTSATSSAALTISKASGEVYTYINHLRANKTINQYTSIYLNGSLEAGSGTIKLYNNGTLINEGNSPLGNLTTFNEVAEYNITTIYEGNENFTASSETWWLNVLEVDIIPPSISIAYPENTTYSINISAFDYTASDNQALEYCWYSLNSGLTNSTPSTCQNFTGLTSNEGSNTWKVYANDTSGNLNSSSITFFKDTIPPLIQFAPPTETDEAEIYINLIRVNVTAEDSGIGLSNITIRLYNSTTDLIRENISTTSPFFINYTTLSSGTYYFNATATDNLNNKNSTGTRTITLAKPTISIISPKNKTYTSNTSLLLNYNADNEESVWYTLNDGATNTTITSSLHFNTSQGSHTLYLYANNTNGIISENVTFFINSSIFLINSSEYESPNKGISTNLNQYSYDEIQNLSNLTLEHTAFGKIQFNERINLTDDENESDDQMNIDEYTNISSNRIEINSTALPNFNKSATLWLYGLTFTNPRILRGRAVCPSTTCIKESYSGGVLKFNVTHFTVYSTEETPAETPSAGTSSAGTGAEVPGIPECTQNSECKEKEVCWHNKCTQLFDIKILNFESPVELGSFFEFTYLIKGMANINDDVGVSFWIERQGKKITSGSDTIYIGSFEEKTESSKIFLPNEVESGVYEFYVEVIHKAYNAKSHRTIEITVKGGEAEITFMRFEGLKTYATIIIGLLSVLILLILFRSVIKLKRVKVSEIKEAVQQPESQIQPAKPELKKAILLHNRASRVNLLNSIKVFFLRVAYRTRYLKLRISPVFKKITRRIKRKLRRQKERERAKLVHNEISRMNLLQIIKVLLLRISYQIKITAIKLSYLVKKITKK